MAKNQNHSKGYLPTLDGWRALAILSVIFCHDRVHVLGPLSTRWLYNYGAKGVDVFFAISGILICSRLLEEEHRFGRISLKDFYVRRAFRILPAAIVYLSVIATLSLAGRIVVYPGEWLGALFFYRNYTRLLGYAGSLAAQLEVHSWTQHFWSLSVEEHFYLLLPGLLLLTRKRLRVPVLLGLAVIVMTNRAVQLHSRSWETIGFHTDVRLDALLIPAVLAVLLRNESFRPRLQRWLKNWPLLLIPTITALRTWPGSFTQTTALVILMPLMVAGSILHSKNFLGLVLESSPARYIGRISYSLYLWHVLFFAGHYYGLTPLGVLQMWPANLVMTFASAMASYHLIERPMIRIGHRLAPPATPGRGDLPGDNLPQTAPVAPLQT